MKSALAILKPEVLNSMNNIDKSWSFSNYSKEKTSYLTHSYHKYPAKFIPQLVQKIIQDYTQKKDLILDPFMGCGTTLLEAKLLERSAIGFDINKLAVLISKVKTQYINNDLLVKHNELLINKIMSLKIRKQYIKANPRLKYWFKESQYDKLKAIYDLILKERGIFKNFYLCCFSNILKNCSIWYQKSVKPMRDLKKKNVKPKEIFISSLNYMTKKNQEFGLSLINNQNIVECKHGDARNLPLKEETIDAVITSPPYATSYEYADIHQLSLLWLGYEKNLQKARKKFIGTSYLPNDVVLTDTKLGKDIYDKLVLKHKRIASNLIKYFSDLSESLKEIKRVLKKDGLLCLVIGDTEYRGVKIQNSKISIEILSSIGFDISDVIRRRISNKTLTSHRNKIGRFTNCSSDKKIYHHEYIIIARKNHE